MSWLKVSILFKWQTREYSLPIFVKFQFLESKDASQTFKPQKVIFFCFFDQNGAKIKTKYLPRLSQSPSLLDFSSSVKKISLSLTCEHTPRTSRGRYQVNY